MRPVGKNNNKELINKIEALNKNLPFHNCNPFFKLIGYNMDILANYNDQEITLFAKFKVE